MTDALFNKDIERIDERHSAAIHRIDERHGMSWLAHKDVHHQEQEAIKVAVNQMERRLDDMNEWRATIGDRDNRLATKEAVAGITDRFARFEEDTRRRFELLDGKLHALEKQGGIDLRAEVRPVQDARVGQLAIIAAIGLAATLLGVLIVVMNFIGVSP